MMSTIKKTQTKNVIIYTIRYTEKEHRKLTTRNKYKTNMMNRIAKKTNGTHIDTTTTDPHTYFQQIAQKLKTSYKLAYYPTNTTKNETFRKIIIQPKITKMK